MNFIYLYSLSVRLCVCQNHAKAKLVLQNVISHRMFSSCKLVGDEKEEIGQGQGNKNNKTKASLSNWMAQVIAHDDNILAINKQSGMTVFGQQYKKGDDSKSSLNDVLPEISAQLNLTELQIGLSLKSYYSGLVLLTKHQHSAQRMKKCLSHAHAQKYCFQTFLAITVGMPQCEMDQHKDIYLKQEYLHDREMSLVSDKPVHKARKDGKMIQTKFRLKTISSNEDTQSSLVQVEICKEKWDAIQVLLSHYLSPVLGDTVYSSRCNYLMGVPMATSAHASIPGQQRLPVGMENALKDGFQLDHMSLPLFLHRHKIFMPGFPSKSEPMEITAPLSIEFKKALNCLGLNFGEKLKIDVE